MKKGDKLRCIFNTILPGNNKGPELELGKEYSALGIFTDKKGYIHVDVGLPLTIGYVTSYATKEELPGDIHWCHPNRFVVID